jgi:acylphosphatase
MTRFRAVIEGRVQGVGFRATTADEGRRLGLLGWVRNRLDGAVEVTAQGDDAAMKSFLEFLHRGPSMARVKSVDVEWLAPQPDLDPFDIR